VFEEIIRAAGRPGGVFQRSSEDIATRISHGRSAEEMNNHRDDGNHEHKMNETTCHVEHQPRHDPNREEK
jgi:hypothetical protein